MFDESEVARDAKGKFSEKRGIAPEVSLSKPAEYPKARSPFSRENLESELRRFVDERIDRGRGTKLYAAWERSALDALDAEDVTDAELALAEVVAGRAPHITTTVELLAATDRARIRREPSEPPRYPYALAFSNRTDREQLGALHREYGEDVANALSSNVNTPPTVLAELAASHDSIVREGVAGNMSTSAETLRTLADDRGPWVAYRVATNRYTPQPLLEEISRRPTREAVAARSTLSSPNDWMRRQPDYKAMSPVMEKLHEADPEFWADLNGTQFD
jgi:hypothetical protein